MAPVLPRLLAPVLPTTYSPSFLHSAKAHAMHEHLEFPYHTFVHCKVFALAILRRVRTLISVSSSGLPLSGPLPIIALVGHYPTNELIGRRLILGHCFSEKIHSSVLFLFGVSHSFPWLSRTRGQIIDVLRNCLLVTRRSPELA